MGLSIFASAGVDISVVGGIIVLVFLLLLLIRLLSSYIKTYGDNRKDDQQQVLPRQNSLANHRSRAIAPEPREPHGGSVSPCAYQENEHLGAESCIVCLYPLQEGTMVIRLPGCGHQLHDVCLSPWFFVNSVCPGCGVPVNAELTVKVGTPV